MNQTIILDGRRFSIGEIVSAARQGFDIKLDQVGSIDSVHRKLIAARNVVEQFARGHEPVYGLNTGLGANLGHRLDPEEIPEFQQQILAGRSVGVGEPFDECVSRASLLSRIITLSKGNSGISIETFDALVSIANAGLSPVLPSRGSIGAGDLILAAHFGSCLFGEGEFWVKGQKVPALQALEQAGLVPINLQAKDAMALCNHSAITTGLGVVTLDEVSRLLNLSRATSVLSAEGYAVNTDIFDADLQQLRPSAGQCSLAAWYRRAFEGSSLLESAGEKSIQDALSFRVMATVYGSTQTALDQAITEVEIELNNAGENPAVLSDRAQMLSTPNFHTLSIALAFDSLAIAVTHVATASFQRIVKMMAPQLSGLPKYLSPVGGASAGFVPIQKTAAALLGEIRSYATPASLDAMPVSDMVEDIAPQTVLAIRQIQQQSQAFRLLIGIEAMVAAQAIDCRQPKSLGRVAESMYSAIREDVGCLDEDRSTGGDIEVILTRIELLEIN